jgi:hypothetical protein
MNKNENENEIIDKKKTMDQQQQQQPSLYEQRHVYSYGYSIPESRMVACIPTSVLSPSAMEMSVAAMAAQKKVGIAESKPNALIKTGQQRYRFGPTEEASYRKMYQESRFALTCKKGGWDALRHYEILANGCIPVFTDLSKCPEDTLTMFPKREMFRALEELLPWTNSAMQQVAYIKHLKILLDYTHQHLTARAASTRMLQRLGNPKSVLLLLGHPGINYSREMTIIGLTQVLGPDKFMEYPKHDILYKSCPISVLPTAYGYGFSYARELTDCQVQDVRRGRIIHLLANDEFDCVIYGKVGPSEGPSGSLPRLPFWEIIAPKIRDKKLTVAFLYGGDHIQSLSGDNADQFYHHLNQHRAYGPCFVRELDKICDRPNDIPNVPPQFSDPPKQGGGVVGNAASSSSSSLKTIDNNEEDSKGIVIREIMAGYMIRWPAHYSPFTHFLQLVGANYVTKNTWYLRFQDQMHRFAKLMDRLELLGLRREPRKPFIIQRPPKRNPLKTVIHYCGKEEMLICSGIMGFTTANQALGVNEHFPTSESLQTFCGLLRPYIILRDADSTPLIKGDIVDLLGSRLFVDDGEHLCLCLYVPKTLSAGRDFPIDYWSSSTDKDGWKPFPLVWIPTRELNPMVKATFIQKCGLSLAQNIPALPTTLIDLVCEYVWPWTIHFQPNISIGGGGRINIFEIGYEGKRTTIITPTTLFIDQLYDDKDEIQVWVGQYKGNIAGWYQISDEIRDLLSSVTE